MIDKFFAPNEVNEIWITFCDPQPKNENRRLTCPRFLERYSSVLCSDAILNLKTDSQELYDYTLDTLKNNNHGILFANNNLYSSGYEGDATQIQTFYEKRFLDEGKPITYIRFRL